MTLMERYSEHLFNSLIRDAAGDLLFPARQWKVCTGTPSLWYLGTGTLSGHNEETKKAAKQKHITYYKFLFMTNQEVIGIILNSPALCTTDLWFLHA